MKAQVALTAILVVTLVIQAARPSVRILVITAGAALACLASTMLGVASANQLLVDVPWDVLVILVGLGLLSELFVLSRSFAVLAVWSTRASRADPRRVIALFATGMYFVSGLVNNLTALVLVLPVVLVLLKLLGARQRYASWAIGVLLVACNLGGAATPIGDFPAILLLGRGSMGFRDYLVSAAPPTLVGLLVILGLTLFVVRPDRGLDRDPVSARLSLAVMTSLHRNVRIDRCTFLPPAIALSAMLVAWTTVPPSSGIGPELICWIGAGAALLVTGRVGERLARTKVDVEAVLFLLSLFVMVAAVRRTGVFGEVARALAALPLPAVGQLVVFLLIAGVLTGIFSAGPSMAALLDVAEVLATRLPPHAVYVGLALSVCAGSSLFLTAATSGPLAQALTERAELRDAEGRLLRFGFLDFLPIGLTSFVVIQGIAVAWALFAVLRG